MKNATEVSAIVSACRDGAAPGDAVVRVVSGELAAMVCSNRGLGAADGAAPGQGSAGLLAGAERGRDVYELGDLHATIPAELRAAFGHGQRRVQIRGADHGVAAELGAGAAVA